MNKKKWYPIVKKKGKYMYFNYGKSEVMKLRVLTKDDLKVTPISLKNGIQFYINVGYEPMKTIGNGNSHEPKK